MSSFSSGIASGTGSSGLDVQATVDQLIYVERAPERLWQKQQALLDAQASALRSIQSKLQTLSEAVNDLKDFTGVFDSRVASTSDSTLVNATATSSAVSGTHAITINSRATTSSYYTKAITDSDFRFGLDARMDISIGAGQVTSLDLSGKSLSEAANYITTNVPGVRANIISDASGSRLSVVSATPGVPGSIHISSDTTALNWTCGTTGANAKLVVDGIPIESTSNTVADVIPGVTLTLSGQNENTTVTLTVGPNSSKTKQAIKAFVDRYNSVIKELNDQFTYNQATKQAGVLASDSTIRAIQGTLLQNISHSVEGNGAFESLRSLGVEMNNDGTLEIEDSDLDRALQDHYAQVQQFFQSTTPEGFARRFGTDLMNINDSTDGPVAVDLKGLDESSKNISDQIDAFEVRITNRQQQLLDQYSRIDMLLRQLPLMQSQITAQLGALNNK
ncbi:MAG TPA: flagellar filament capping protein FliD [Terriglobales bacterium]|nr:flagellar filament capping protein FliD [Terriglobales bacterium]